MVRQGEIAEGMNADGVFLAWGAPSRIYEFSKDGKQGKRWDYSVSVPIRHHDYFNPYDRYYRRYDRFPSESVTYVSRKVASVWFINDKLTSWERQR